MAADTEAPERDVMLYVGDATRSFRCDCECNVFRRVRPGTFRCNSCRAVWVGDAVWNDAPTKEDRDGN